MQMRLNSKTSLHSISSLFDISGLWLSSSTFEYRRCLLDKVKDQMGKQNDTRPMDHMMHTLQPYCPDSIQVCAERGCDIFMNLSRNIQSGGLFLNKLHQSLRNETLLQDFIRTRKVFKAAVDSCVEKLHIPCVTSQLLVVKALRLTMNTVRILLRDDPDLRLVYLVRDPRGILQSRKTVRYLTEGLQTDLNREAALLCPKMTRDLSGFEKLKQEFAERVLLLRYEDAADQPQEVVDRVYEFIGEFLFFPILLTTYKRGISAFIRCSLVFRFETICFNKGLGVEEHTGVV